VFIEASDYALYKSTFTLHYITRDDGGGGDNWTTGAMSRAKLQLNHHHQPTNAHFFYRPDALPVAQPTASKH